MNTNHKILLGCIFILFFSAMLAAETIFIPKEAPIFKHEKVWTVKAKAQNDFTAEVIKKERVFLQQENIGTFVDAYHLNIPGTEGLYYMPEVHFKFDDKGNTVQYFDKIESLMFLGIFLIIAGLAVIAFYFHLQSEKKKYLLPLSLLLFFWGYATWYIGMITNTFVFPTDEASYFAITKQLLNLDFSSVQYHPIGFPIFLIPFTLLFHLKDCMDFVFVYMNFQTFILIPMLFLLLYWFFQKKMGCSRHQSYCILLLWIILIILYNIYLSYSAIYSAESYSSCANCVLPSANSISSCIQCEWLGRNAKCDYITVFLFVLLLSFSMKRSRSLIRFFILSMGFGFVCLVRINYIFFAPLLAYVFYDSFSELWKDKKNYLYAFLCGVAGFMLVFVWQFIMNQIQFGSPFVWPYSLHPFAPDRGFVPSIVPYGFKPKLFRIGISIQF